MPRIPLFAALVTALAFGTPTMSQSFGSKQVLHQVSMSGNNEWGRGLAVVGDVDGDGVDDVALGAPGRLFGAGRVRVNSGATGSVLWQVNGPPGALRFGHSIARLPDQNGDSVCELAVGAPLSNIGGAQAGAVFVLSGADGMVLATVAPNLANHHVGESVAVLRIQNTTFIAASRPNANGMAGGFSLYDPLTGLSSYDLAHVVPNDRCGAAIANAGDFDGDGSDDLIVGYPGRTNANGGTGEARIYIFRPFALPSTRIISGGADAVAFASSVAGAGDIDADGLSDVIIGDPLATVNMLTECGRVRTYTGPEADLYASEQGVGAYWHAGASVAGIGDLDGDGFDDIAYGAPQISPSIATGRVVVKSGRTNSTLGVMTPASPDVGYGTVIAPAGDFDDDNLADLLVADVDENFVEVVGPIPTYPGSHEDLVLGVGLFVPHETTWPDVRAATGPVSMSLMLSSPGGTHVGAVPVIAAWIRPTAGLPVDIAGFPELHLSIPAAVIIFDPFTAPVFGPTLLSTSGLALGGILPGGLGGNTLMVQGFVLAPSASTGNPFFTATNALAIEL